MSRIAESELIINPRGAVYHLDLRPEEIAGNCYVRWRSRPGKRDQQAL